MQEGNQRFSLLPNQITGVIMALTLVGCASTPPPTQEMSDARQSIEAAENVGADNVAPKAMNDAQELLNRAEGGMREGKFDEAQQDALAAQQAAKQALAITEQHQQQTAQTSVAPEPKQAQIRPMPAPVARPTFQTYTVQEGDSLWSIAAQHPLYHQAQLWPLIYLHNHQNISDADLIYPGQRLKLLVTPNEQQRQQAINHANNRGPWRLNYTEKTDLEYLAQAQ